MEIWDFVPDIYQKMVNDMREIFTKESSDSQTKDLQEIIKVAINKKNSYILPSRISYNSFNGKSITSYGCILRSLEKEVRYLLVRRKHSVDYIDIIRGGWSISNLPLLLTNITQKERQKLFLPFDTLWVDLITQPTEGSNYEYAKYRFSLLTPYISALLEKIPCCPEGEANMWHFPKGRIDYTNSFGEQPIKCAIREFKEETYGYDLKDSRMFSNRVYFEEYTGTNSKKYRAEYFVFLTNEAKKIEDPISKDAEMEIVRWMTLSDIKLHLNRRKISLIEKIEEDIGKKI